MQILSLPEGRQQQEEMRRVQQLCLPSCLQVWELAGFLGSWEPDMGEYLQTCYKTVILLTASISKRLNKAARFPSTPADQPGQGNSGKPGNPQIAQCLLLKSPIFQAASQEVIPAGEQGHHLRDLYAYYSDSQWLTILPLTDIVYFYTSLPSELMIPP